MRIAITMLLTIVAIIVWKPVFAQDDPIELRYGDIYQGTITVPGGNNATYHTIGFWFSGTKGETINLQLETDSYDGIQVRLSLYNLTTDEYTIGEKAIFDPLFTDMYRIENFVLPSTGSYGIVAEFSGAHGYILPQLVAYYITIDGRHIGELAQLKELSGYTIAYQRIPYDLGGQIQPTLNTIMLARPGKTPTRPNYNLPTTTEFCPDWSSDGRTLLYGFTDLLTGAIGGIGAMPINGGPRQLVLNNLKGFVGAPRYSPDNSMIAFHQETSPDVYEIFVFDTITRQIHQLTELGVWSRYPSWSPDGSHLIFHSDRAGNYDLYTIGVDGSELNQLTTNPNDEVRAVYSPDGTQIVYALDETENSWGHLYIMDASGGNQTPLVAAGEYNTIPEWTPDGEWIVYQRAAGNSGHTNLYFIKATGGTPVRITDLDRNFSHECASVSPIVAGTLITTAVPTRVPPAIVPSQGDMLVTWGDNGNNQLNVSSVLDNVQAIATGLRYSVVLKKDGTAMIWGGSNSGYVPSYFNDLTAVATNHDYVLGLKSDGAVVLWGSEYPDGVIVPELDDIVAVTAGTYHGVALKSDGTVIGWGTNDRGQIDIPDGLSDVVAVAAGFKHTLALKSDGTVVGWGWNEYGQAEVPNALRDVIAISAGMVHSLALKRDGTLVAWGDNRYGQADVPTGLRNVVAISAGFHHNLALKSNGTVIAWGANDHEQGSVPLTLKNVKAVAAGSLHNLVVVSSSPVTLSVTLPQTWITSTNTTSANTADTADSRQPKDITGVICRSEVILASSSSPFSFDHPAGNRDVIDRFLYDYAGSLGNESLIDYYFTSTICWDSWEEAYLALDKEKLFRVDAQKTYDLSQEPTETRYRDIVLDAIFENNRPRLEGKYFDN
jgi:hypothetical protein